MRPGRALSALEAPTSVVDALFQRGNGQQEDATGMPAGKRSRGDDDVSEETWAGIVTSNLYTLIACDARIAELNLLMAPQFHQANQAVYRSAEGEGTFRSLGQHDDPPGARPKKPWVDLELERLAKLRTKTDDALRAYFRPNQFKDPIFRPYNDDETWEVWNQTMNLQQGMEQLDMGEEEQPEAPSSTVDPEAESSS